MMSEVEGNGRFVGPCLWGRSVSEEDGRWMVSEEDRRLLENTAWLSYGWRSRVLREPLTFGESKTCGYASHER